jgi:hypothetical protein
MGTEAPRECSSSFECRGDARAFPDSDTKRMWEWIRCWNHLRAHPHVHVGDGKPPAALSLQVNPALDAQCPPPAPPATVIPQSAIPTANLSTSLGFGCACGLRGIQQRRRIAPNYRHLMNSSAISRRRFVWLMNCASCM